MDTKFLKLSTTAVMSVIPAAALWYLNKDDIMGPTTTMTTGTTKMAPEKAKKNGINDTDAADTAR